MDPALYTLLIIGLLVIVVGLPIFQIWARKKAAGAGANLGKKFADKRLPPVLAEFAKTLVIHAPEQVAHQIVTEAASKKPKSFFARPDGTFSIKFSSEDDTIMTLTPTTGGFLLQVVRFRDYLGFPQTVRDWTDLREAITEVAQSRGVAVSPGPVLRHERQQQLTANDAAWGIAA
ncbi:hypothetical protein [Humidisolicoccus flavus]|uniref:hypothetical protein n=1 Tax=Humidisolicoccus flavus TaxID=3111414 RepID=UPI003254F7A8